MKHQVFTCILFCMVLSGMGQFVPQPLNYPGPGYWPFYYSIVDPDHVWVGTIHESGLPTPFSVKTTDGGDSWIFDSIPVQGVPSCVSVCGWDPDTCFFVFADINGSIDPSVWKTTDGGITWTNIITTQFTGSFINFYHAFSADTGIAMGDPRDGYFEIQITNDGGATWTRVPSSDIPAFLPNEMGLGNSYSAVGNSIWFTTNMCRCFRSSNRGQTWDVTEVFPGVPSDCGVCFSTEQKGVFWKGSSGTLVVTTDAGVTWDTVSFPAGYTVWEMSRVPGWEGGFMVTAYKSGMGMNVYFTPDMFNTIQMIQAGMLSIGAIEFYDVATGWLGGGESGTNEIYKFTWVLSSGRQFAEGQNKISILPNPSSGQALLKLPEGLDPKDPEIRIISMTGKEVARFPVPGRDYITLDASQLANGVYLVVLYSGNSIFARERWIVTR